MYKAGDVIEINYVEKDSDLTKGNKYVLYVNNNGDLVFDDDVGDEREIEPNLYRIKLVEREENPKPKFKVGDRVRCINTGKVHCLEIGKEYVIKYSDLHWVGVNFANQEYDPSRFELVEEQTHMTLDSINEELKSITRQSDDLVKRERMLHEIRNLIELGYRVTAPEKST